MSKTMEQASLASGSSAGRDGRLVQESNKNTSKTEHQFGIKETIALLGVAFIMAGIIGYAVYFQGTRATPEMAIAEPVSPAHTVQAQSLGAAIPQPVQVSQSLPISPTSAANQEAHTAESQTESKHADIYFDFGKSRLRADATAVLQQHAGLLKKDGNWAVLIQGYADQHGPAEYNRILALRRAESVKQFLIELGVPESSLRVVSLGKDSAICDDERRSCRRLNRRVHVEMVKLDMEPVTTPIATTTEGITDLTPALDPPSAAPDGPAIDDNGTNPSGQP